MRDSRILSICVSLTSMAGLHCVHGCGVGSRDVPSAVIVELPDGTEVTATQGSGVISLADTEWDFFATAANAQGAAFLRLRFGPNGNLAAFENNTLASEIFGSTILFDGARHNTTQQGLQYAAATYGAETSDGSGFAFEGVLTAFAAGLEAANATAAATGEFVPEDPNLMHGTFEFTSQVTLLNIPEGNQDVTINFEGRRVRE